VDLVPFALMRSLVRDRVETDHDGVAQPDLVTSEAIVCIGAGVTNVVVHEHGVPRFVRMLIVGGGDVTEAIAENLSVDFDTAEALKRRANLESEDDLEVQAAQIVHDRAIPILEEIRGSLDYYLAQSGSAEIGRILLSGGGSLLGDLRGRLEETLGIPVEIGHPLLGVKLGRTGIDDERLLGAEPLLAVPVGLALGGFPSDGRVRRLSLLPTELAEVRAQKRQAMRAGVGVVVLAAALGFAWHSQGAKVAAERRRADEVEQESSVLQRKIGALQSATVVDQQVAQREKLVTAALVDDVDWTRLLREIATVMPQDVWLTSFSSNGNALTLAAQGADHTSAARFLMRMSELTSLSEVWLPSSTKPKPGAAGGGDATFGATAQVTAKAQSQRVDNYVGDAK
jgi:Tfp pilus assembly protein PilN